MGIVRGIAVMSFSFRHLRCVTSLSAARSVCTTALNWVRSQEPQIEGRLELKARLLRCLVILDMVHEIGGQLFLPALHGPVAASGDEGHQ